MALPEIARLGQTGPNVQAFRLAREARRFLPDDRGLRQWWREVTAPVSIRTTPPGAAVEWRDYSAADDSPWESLGSTPIGRIRVPNAYLRWRISKEGFDPVEAAFSSWTTSDDPVPTRGERLDPAGHGSSAGWTVPIRPRSAVEVEDYWLDKYEVTNREFKEFVDAGGYRKREYWRHPFVKDGRELTWEQAMEEFRDTTGRPGASTWALGTYSDGQAEFPVGGVSWFEAAAYATFKGKSLPSGLSLAHTPPTSASSRTSISSPTSEPAPPVWQFHGMARGGALRHGRQREGMVRELRLTIAATSWAGVWGERRHMFSDPMPNRPSDGWPTTASVAPRYPASDLPINSPLRSGR